MQTIVYLMNHLVNKGPVNVLYDICKNIDRSKYKPVIITFLKERSEGSIAYKFRDLDIDIICLNESYLKIELMTFSISRKVQKIINNFDSCIIHSHCYHPTLVAGHLHGVKNITTIHNIAYDDYTMKHGKFMGLYMTYRFRRILRKMDCSVALSDAMKEYYNGCCNNLIRIYNGVDCSNEYSSEDRIKLKRKLMISENKKIILVSGSLIPRKNVEYIISELKSSNKQNFICIIVGAGPCMDACKSITNTDERFRFDGFVNNIKDYLAISDLCISASKSEGLPLGVLEALGQGVPMILSSIPPHREIYNTLKTDEIKLCDCCAGQLKNLFESVIDYKHDNNLIASLTKEYFSSEIMTRNYELEYSKISK